MLQFVYRIGTGHESKCAAAAVRCADETPRAFSVLLFGAKLTRCERGIKIDLELAADCRWNLQIFFLFILYEFKTIYSVASSSVDGVLYRNVF